MQSSDETARTAEYGLRQPLLDLAISRPESHADISVASITATLSQVRVGHANHATTTPSHPFMAVKVAA
ncbi:hypothetical protein [Candidatus Poriferisodalis sp.]|uniref:hypothetical protein n=1 Tax=Candidatus Poriferisodalis sp. TaxID=3101277 RepID=UPI003B0148F9